MKIAIYFLQRMTLDTGALDFLLELCIESLYPKDIDRENNVGCYDPMIGECEVMIQDLLIYMRGIKKWNGGWEDNDMDVDEGLVEDGDELKIKTYGDMMMVLFSYAKKVLEEEPQLRYFVFRMDILGKTPKAKYTIYGKRYKDIPDFEYPEGVEESEIFCNDRELPENMNSIFKSFRLKKLLYVYITNYIMKYFTHIPENKCVILDGGIIHVDDEESVPIVMYTGEANDDGYEIVTKVLHDRYHFTSTLGEADLAVYFWRDMLSKNVTMIKSEDGDMITIGLLGCVRRYTLEDKFTDGMNTFICKKRMCGSKPYEGREMERREELKKTNRFVRTNKLLKEANFIHIERMYQDLIEKNWYGKEHNTCKHPVELMCVLICMRGNDFVRSIPRLGWKTLTTVFQQDMKTYGTVVQVRLAKSSQGKNLLDTLIEQGEKRINNNIYEYGIVTVIMMKFVVDILLKVFPKIKKEFADIVKNRCNIFGTTKKHADDMTVALQLMDKHYEEKYKPFKNVNDFYGHCANISWCLAYFANGYINNHTFSPSLTKDPQGHSLHGYAKIDESKPATSDNIQYATDVQYQEIFWTS